MKRVEYFTLVRDIPYTLWGNQNDTNCAIKNEVLASYLDELGLEYEKKLCKFNWNDLDIPNEIFEDIEDTESYHEFLKVHLPNINKKVIVDPTWDEGLDPRFPVNYWDGRSNTKIAVEPCVIYDAEESRAIKNEIIGEGSTGDYQEFYSSLNTYLNSVRNGD